MKFGQQLPQFSEVFEERGNSPSWTEAMRKINSVVRKLRELVRIIEAPERATSETAVQNVTADFGVTAEVELVLADATSGALNVTLPDATENFGRSITVKRINAGANAVTLNTVLAQTIDGAATQALAAQWNSYTVASNGVNWFISAAV